ncbi:MAG: TonB-dependent receptor plug domain-containing protein [Neisseriaceae bacterium]|nr:TonB-dependent receptor plug domain-containing protein [Neisseriaceae bacterium]
MRVLNRKQKILTLSLMAVFSSVAYAQNQSQTAGRVALSDDNHAQMAAENVRKINGIENSGSLNVPTDLQVTGYQPEINQSYDLKNNSQFLLPASNQANTVDWQIDDSYALENNHFSGSLKNVFQQDNDSVLLAENTVTETQTDAVSGSLNDDKTTQNQENQNTPIPETANKTGAVELTPIRVTARASKTRHQAYTNKVKQKEIENMATGNGDIASAIRALPNVQFSNLANSSTNPGEIEPKNFSISGGLYYQNNIMLDGLSINNDISPAGAGAEGNSWNTARWLGMPAGRSQGMAIDVSLLESLEVQDMNIPVSYGHFQGGVVEAKTKKPSEDLVFKISHRYTNGNFDKGFPHSLTKYQIPEENHQSFRDTVTSDWQQNQPEFYKQITKISGEAQINDEWGIIGQLGRTWSKIPVWSTNEYLDNANSANYATPLYHKGANPKYKVNQERMIYNGFLKAYYDPTPDLNFEFSYTWAPDYRRIYIPGTNKNTYTDLEHGGHLFNFTTRWNNDWGYLKNVLGYSWMQDTNTAHGYDNNKYWVVSENKNWGTYGGISREGGWLPGEQVQQIFTNKFSQEFKPFHIKSSEHTIETGLELSHKKAHYKRDKEFFHATGAFFMTKEQQEKCKKTGGQWCDTSLAYYTNPNNRDNIIKQYTDGINAVEEIYKNPTTGQDIRLPKWLYGQYFTQATQYFPLDIGLSNNQMAFYIQDDIKIPLGEKNKYGELGFRPGVRFERDTFSSKNAIAPRFVVDYQFPWNNRENSIYATGIEFGANRYYGRTVYEMALADGVQKMQRTVKRNDPSVDWHSITRICTDKNDKDNCYTPQLNGTKFEELKLPYDDELAFGLAQDIGNWRMVGKYIYREGKDEIRRVSRAGIYQGKPILDDYSESYYYYDNIGRSRSNIISLMIKNKQPFEIAGVKNTLQLSADWSDVKRNYTDYGSSSNAELNDYWINYNGMIMKYSNRPSQSQNYTNPWTIKLNTNHEWNMLGGKWNLNNLFTFKSKHKTFGYIKDEPIANYPHLININGYKWLDYYGDVQIPSTFTWDVKLGAEYAVYKKNKLFFNIDVTNVTNKKNTVAITNKGVPTYNIGRAIWLEGGYKF